MSRQIKFRAWDKKLHIILPHEELSPQDGKLVYGRRATLDSILLHDDYEVMQFTGFKDAGNIDIYEGDIIENDGDKYIVEWCENTGKWDCIGINTEDNISLCEFCPSNETWIQGNIHKHAHLLNN